MGPLSQVFLKYAFLAGFIFQNTNILLLLVNKLLLDS